MAIKLKDLGFLKNQIRDNTMKVYTSMEEYEADTDKRNISYVISDKGWTKVSTLSINGNRAVIVAQCTECPIVEHYEPTISVNMTNKLPGALLKEIVETFARVCNGGSGEALKGAEAAAQIYKHSETGEYFIYYPEQKVSGASVTYADDPGMLENRQKHTLVFECHSHNSMGAFWSGTDNANEREFGYYMVIGKLNMPNAEYKFRVKYESTYGDLKAHELFDITEEEEKAIFCKDNWGEGNPEIDTKAKTNTYTYTYKGGGYHYTSDGQWEGYWGVGGTTTDYASKWKSVSGRGSRRRSSRRKGHGSNGLYSSSSYCYGYDNYYDDMDKFDDWLAANPDVTVIKTNNPIYKVIDNLSDWNEGVRSYGAWSRELVSNEHGAHEYMYVYNDPGTNPVEHVTTAGIIDMLFGHLNNDDTVSGESVYAVLSDEETEVIADIFDCDEKEVEYAFVNTASIKIGKMAKLIKLMLDCEDVNLDGVKFSDWLVKEDEV